MTGHGINTMLLANQIYLKWYFNKFYKIKLSFDEFDNISYEN